MKNRITKKTVKANRKHDYIRANYDLYSTKESKTLTKVLAFQIAKQAGCHREKLMELIRNDDYAALASYDIPYSDYSASNTRHVAAVRQVLAFYSKDNELKIEGVSPSINCLKGFIETEKKCKQTNARLATLMKTDQWISDYPFLYAVTRKISSWLGNLPQKNEYTFSFGPGSTTNVAKRNASPLNKLNAASECSCQMVQPGFGLDFLRSFYHLNKNVVVVPAKFGMVPKNAFTLRTTVTEPGLNMPAQKFLGKAIRKRLAQIGLDLNIGQSENQELALLGSISNEIATVDAKNASNTISIFAVYLLLYLSKDWFDALDSCRSPCFLIGDSTHYITEMFSSMGNGFTFELETLIFHAITTTACEYLGFEDLLPMVKTYGDDMVIPCEIYEFVVEWLLFLGFEINVEKTFVDGPFRESCGKDYFYGINIRPFYKKDKWTKARLIAFLNHDSRNHLFCDEHLRSFLLRSHGPFLFGPDGYGDGHVIPVWQSEIQNFTMYHRVTRTIKQRFKHGDAHGRFFYSIIKLPLKQLEIREKEIGSTDSKLVDHLSSTIFPLYAIHNKHSERNIYSEYVIVDGELNKRIVIFDDEGNLKDIRFGRETDPYTLPNGWRERVVKIYVLNPPDIIVI